MDGFEKLIMRITAGLLLCAALPVSPQTAMADAGCTLVVDNQTAAIIHEHGDCKTRRAPNSTFKLPLALMGFESGILKDAHNPAWAYKPEYDADMEKDRHKTDPVRWEKESVVWFSQKLTRELGTKKFKSYVDAFNYGNKDISGDAGKNNGLTHSWLSSSLKISPVEQVGFIRTVLNRSLPLSDKTYDSFMTVAPEFAAGDWVVHGKTGSGFERNPDGSLNRIRQRGWFVGWAERDSRKIVFAKFIADEQKTEGYAGPRARDTFLKELPSIMKHDAHHNH